MKRALSYFGFLFLFLFFTFTSLAETLDLSNEEFYHFQEGLFMAPSLNHDNQSNSQESNAFLHRKDVNQIYLKLTQYLLKNGYKTIDSEIKKMLFQILDLKYFRNIFSFHPQHFLSISQALFDLHQNNKEYKSYSNFKKDLIFNKRKIGSIYFLDQNKNSSIPSIFFRTKDTYENRKKFTRVFSKILGRKKIVKMVLGYPDMKMYALSVPSKLIKLESEQTHQKKLMKSFKETLEKENSIYETLLEKENNNSIGSEIVEILYSGDWSSNQNAFDEQYITIQPFYQGRSLVEFVNEVNSDDNKDRKLFFQDKMNFEIYKSKFLRRYSIILQQLKLSAKTFHNLLSNFRLIHINIKPDHILVDMRDKIQTRIGGFENSELYQNKTDQKKLTTFSASYTAPECRKPLHTLYDINTLEKCDVYSFGMTLYESLKYYFIPQLNIFFSEYIPALQKQDFNAMKNYYPFYFPLLEVIDQTLHIDPNQRPTFHQIYTWLDRIEKQNENPFIREFENQYYYTADEKTYHSLIEALLKHTKFSFRQKTIEQWKEIFSFDHNLQLIMINTLQTRKNIIYVDLNKIQNIFNEIEFLHALGRLKL